MLKREGHKSTNTMIRESWPEWEGELRKQPGGWNNTTYIVEKEERRAVLRIYNTHRDSGKIEFEHAVLQKLGGIPLPFKVPLPILTATGGTLARSGEDDGKFACLFTYIEGETPSAGNSSFYESFGEATGVLSLVLADVDPGMPAAYLPYYELGDSYPLCTPDKIQQLYLHPPESLRDLSGELKMLGETFETIQDSMPELKELPHQLVHGDLNASNVLLATADPGQVVALLDFEFCTFDVRAMEPAVVLSGLLGQEKGMPLIQDFWRGYSRQVRLSREEIRAIPTLILLRKMDVFLHFLTRYLEGTDEVHVLREHVEKLAVQVPQLMRDTVELQGLLRKED